MLLMLMLVSIEIARLLGCAACVSLWRRRRSELTRSAAPDKDIIILYLLYDISLDIVIYYIYYIKHDYVLHII